MVTLLTPTGDSDLLRIYKAKTGLWVFDDDRVGLVKEPFIKGADEIIDALVAKHDIPDPDNGFLLMFSYREFDGAEECLTRGEPEDGGCWYRWGEMKGWLCPALYKYFSEAPEQIWLILFPRMEPVKPANE